MDMVIGYFPSSVASFSNTFFQEGTSGTATKGDQEGVGRKGLDSATQAEISAIPGPSGDINSGPTGGGSSTHAIIQTAIHFGHRVSGEIGDGSLSDADPLVRAKGILQEWVATLGTESRANAAPTLAGAFSSFSILVGRQLEQLCAENRRLRSSQAAEEKNNHEIGLSLKGIKAGLNLAISEKRKAEEAVERLT